MSAPSAVLQLHHRETFERNVARIVAAGALAGALQALGARVGLAPPLATLVLIAAVLAVLGGDRWDRGLLATLGVLLPALPHAFGLTAGWTLGLSGALTGALLVRAHLCQRGVDGGVADSRPTQLHLGLGALAGAGLALAGWQVAAILGLRLEQLETPSPLVPVLMGSVLALFVALASLAAHVGLTPDPVEARAAELLPRLPAVLHEPVSRALSTYRSCGALLAELPRDPARDELARTLARLTAEVMGAADGWAGVEAQLGADTTAALSRERADLSRSASAARDPLARRQLELAAEALREEEERLGELGLERERVVARLRSNAALLERARISLLGVRGGAAAVKGIELAALTRKLRTLSDVQHEDARAQQLAAAGAELATLSAPGLVPQPSLPAVTDVSPSDPGSLVAPRTPLGRSVD